MILGKFPFYLNKFIPVHMVRMSCTQTCDHLLTGHYNSKMKWCLSQYMSSYCCRLKKSGTLIPGDEEGAGLSTIGLGVSAPADDCRGELI